MTIPLLGAGPAAPGAASLTYLLRDEFTTAEAAPQDSHGSNHLTRVNGPTSAAGKVGNAGQFAAASSQHLTVSSNSTLQTGNVDWWCAGWVNPNALVGNQAIASKYAAGNFEFLVYLASASLSAQVVKADGSAADTVNGSNATAGAWNFFFAWHDATAGTINIKVNNGATASTARTQTLTAGSAAFQLARTASASFQLDGLLDSIAFGKSPSGGFAGTTPEAISTSLYNGGAGKAYSSLTAQEKSDWGLVSYWSLDDVAAMVSPRTAEPGPGTLTVVDSGSNWSISSGRLQVAGGSNAYEGNTVRATNAIARAVSRAFLIKVRPNATTTHSRVGWLASLASMNDPVEDASLHFAGDGSINARISADPIFLSTFSAATEYEVAQVLRSTGVFFLIRGGAFTDWTLLWLKPTGNTATLYPFISNYSMAGYYDSFRVTALPTPWDDDHGIATQRLAGSVSAGTTFTHTANCLIEWTQTTLPSSGTSQIYFRKQDATNYWSAYIDTTGGFSLYEVINSAYTARASAAGVVANGHRCVVIADGSVIRGYSNNTLRWTYSSASGFASETDGEVGVLSGGSAVADVIAWPRDVSAHMPAGV